MDRQVSDYGEGKQQRLKVKDWWTVSDKDIRRQIKRWERGGRKVKVDGGQTVDIEEGGRLRTQYSRLDS